MAGLTTTVTVDGKEVTFRASAEILRMYRFKFRRDVLIDMRRIGQDMQRKKKTGADIPIESLTIFENIAYIMAKHGDKDAVPDKAARYYERERNRRCRRTIRFATLSWLTWACASRECSPTSLT